MEARLDADESWGTTTVLQLNPLLPEVSAPRTTIK
jgi:hypothetical protein